MTNDQKSLPCFFFSHLTEPPLGAAEERPTFPVCDDLVEEPHLTFGMRYQSPDAKPGDKKSRHQLKHRLIKSVAES